MGTVEEAVQVIRSAAAQIEAASEAARLREQESEKELNQLRGLSKTLGEEVRSLTEALTTQTASFNETLQLRDQEISTLRAEKEALSVGVALLQQGGGALDSGDLGDDAAQLLADAAVEMERLLGEVQALTAENEALKAAAAAEPTKSAAGGPPVYPRWSGGGVLDLSIDSLPWSNRTKNSLKNNLGVTTVRALVGLARSQVMKTKNFGEKCMSEVDGWLSAQGLALAEEAAVVIPVSELPKRLVSGQGGMFLSEQASNESNPSQEEGEPAETLFSSSPDGSDGFGMDPHAAGDAEDSIGVQAREDAGEHDPDLENVNFATLADECRELETFIDSAEMLEVIREECGVPQVDGAPIPRLARYKAMLEEVLQAKLVEAEAPAEPETEVRGWPEVAEDAGLPGSPAPQAAAPASTPEQNGGGQPLPTSLLELLTQATNRIQSL